MTFKTYKYSDINSIIFELMNNKAVIIPTDTIIGILAKDKNIIYKIKQRSTNKKIIRFISNKNVIPNLNKDQIEFLNKFWPGTLTIIKSNISYRIPNESHLLYILDKFDYLYCSSANISNQDCISHPLEANNTFDVSKYFYNLIIVDEPGIGVEPSTIVNIDRWQILRRGANVEAIENWINNLNVIQTQQVYILVEANEYSFFSTKLAKNKRIKILKLNEKKFNSTIKNVSNNDALIISHNPEVWDYLANKTPFVRSGIVYSNELASLIKLHDDVHVANFDLNLFTNEQILEQIYVYLDTKFEGGRHLNRVNTIVEYEENN
ncbi:MAG: Sua5/YciO/YrdC/YwlC family protein [Ureaplasma sp.]|nr:Sua5/YciO/YrdC/YwlC family protein [Ureaplasma sp.]